MILISLVVAGGIDLYETFFKEKEPEAKVQKERTIQYREDITITEVAQAFKQAMKDSNTARLDTLIAASVPEKKAKKTKLAEITDAAISAAEVGVKIALGLIGVMALWLGIMKIGEEAGLIKKLALLVRPITKWLFPTIPSDHPAIGAMIMNISANMLGLSNAATPMGLKAMDELQKLNDKKDEASDDMITFLVINTSAITLIPASAIAIRASLGSANPQQIIVPAILAATMATIVGLTTVKTLQYFERKKKKGDK